MSTSRPEKNGSGAWKSEGQLKKEFSARLRRLREARGQTQSQVAKALGFASESVYQLWEKGDGNLPSALNLQKLAFYFHVSTDYLLGLQEEQPKVSPTGKQPDEDEKKKARRAVFDLAWHGKNWDSPEVEPLLWKLYRSEESLERCYDRVITDVLLSAHPEDLPALSNFYTPAALAVKKEIERLFRERPGDQAREVTMHVLDLSQVPSDRFQRNIIGMQGAQLMKDRMKGRQKAFTLAVSSGWMAREVLFAPNLARGDIENVTVIPLTLGRSRVDETSTTTTIGYFGFKHGDYGVKMLNLKDKGPKRIASRARAIDLAFMGIGALEPSDRKSVFAELLAEKQLSHEELEAQGVIGSVLYHLTRENPSGLFWDIYKPPAGKEITVDIDDPAGDEIYHVLSLDVLRELVELGETQIVVLVKDPLRARVVRAALEMRWANSVICSLPVADELSSLLKARPA
jgi:transcriptional regulator with XRE-family HTH domain